MTLGNLSSGFPTNPTQTGPCTEDGWRLEILDLKVEGLYFPCSENKGTDQLPLTSKVVCVLVFHLQKAGFLMTRLVYNLDATEFEQYLIMVFLTSEDFDSANVDNPE